MACVMSGLVENAEIDPADLCVNDAGMRLSSRVASWSEAGERLRSRASSGEWKDPARQALTQRSGAYAQGSATLPGGSHGCRGYFRTAVCAAQDGLEETVVVEAVEGCRHGSCNHHAWSLMLRMLCKVCWCWLRRHATDVGEGHAAG